MVRIIFNSFAVVPIELCVCLFCVCVCVCKLMQIKSAYIYPDKDVFVKGGSNMTGTDLYVNKPHCVAAVRPWESEATTSTLPPARVRTCLVLSGSC